MTTQTTETIIDKIKKLLAMAEHPNSNEHEAAIAMEKAQQLLFEHNLTRADIATPDNTDGVAPGIGTIDGTENHGYVWKRFLLSTIARNSLCRIVVTPSRKAWHLFGTYDNVKATLEMYHWITPELESIALRAWRNYQNNGGYESARRWKQGFFMGAIKTIGDRLESSLKTFTATQPGNALIVYNDKQLSAAVHKVFPRLGQSRISVSSGSGYQAGRAAGSSIRLQPQRHISAGHMALGAGY